MLRKCKIKSKSKKSESSSSNIDESTEEEYRQEVNRINKLPQLVSQKYTYTTKGMRQGRKLRNTYLQHKDDITIPPKLRGKQVDYLRNQFLALDPKMTISDEGLRVFKNSVNQSDSKQANKLLYGVNWKKIYNDKHLLKRIEAYDDIQQLLEDQQEQRALLQKEIKENFNRLVKENEGIDDSRFSTIQSSLPPPIDPQRIQRIQEHNVNDRLAEPSNQMGSMAQPPNPDTQFNQLGEVVPKEYEQILKETDGEQQPFKASQKDDALQQQIYDNDNNQFYPKSEPIHYSNKFQSDNISNWSRISNFDNRSIQNGLNQVPTQISQFQKDQMQQVKAEYQMGDQQQENNDEVIDGLKYLVGSTGWGKQPINAYFDSQHFPDRTFQWYTNEGQTVLRQAKVKLNKQQLLNIPAKKKNYIKTKELKRSIKAQKQLRKK